MIQATTTPRVWIADLAAYNEGHLHGEWVDATLGVEELVEAGKRIIASSPAYSPEELAIHDHEGFGGILGEYDGFEYVAALAEAIEENGDAFLAYMKSRAADLYERDVDAIVESFRERYCGEFESEEDFAREQVSECGWHGVPAQELEVPNAWPAVKLKVFEELEDYLDWETIARDIFLNGYSHVDGYVFRDW